MAPLWRGRTCSPHRCRERWLRYGATRKAGRISLYGSVPALQNPSRVRGRPFEAFSGSTGGLLPPRVPLKPW